MNDTDRQKRPAPCKENRPPKNLNSAPNNAEKPTIVKLDSDVELIAVQQGVHSNMKRAAAACPPGKTRLVVSKVRRLPGIIGYLTFSTREGWNLFEAEDCPEGRRFLAEFVKSIQKDAKQTFYPAEDASCN